jgi:hypothetical protein
VRAVRAAALSEDDGVQGADVVTDREDLIRCRFDVQYARRCGVQDVVTPCNVCGRRSREIYDAAHVPVTSELDGYWHICAACMRTYWPGVAVFAELAS